MTQRLTLLVAGLTLGLAGCSSSFVTQQLPKDPAVGTPVNGLPFRTRDQLEVELYHKGEKGYEKVATTSALMADPTQTYVLGFKGSTFATSGRIRR